MISRRALLQTSAAPALAQSGGRPPNIVFLISDDHSAPHLGLRTPNLDRLARDGMRFTRAFVASPQCSPNRSAILTGCSPHTTCTSRLHTPLPEWEQTILEPLKARGYFTGAFRKVHQGKAFDARWDFYRPGKTPFRDFFDAAPSDRPFFLHVGFTDPHRPYAAGAASPPHDPGSMRVPPFLPDTPEVRADLALYHDAITRMDSECGAVLELLEARGLAGNTLVIFTGDNGMPFPGAKGTCYDPGIHVPMIARWPGRVRAGSVRDELLSHVDLAPTWLEAAGIGPPKKMQGRSALPLLTGGLYTPRKEIFSERNWHDNFDPMRAVRTTTHKLIFNAAPHFPYRPAWDIAQSPSWKIYPDAMRSGKHPPELLRLMQPARPVVELYDIERDPNEFHNLAGHASHSATQAELIGRLSQWMHDTYDFLPPGTPGPGEPQGRVWPLSL